MEPSEPDHKFVEILKVGRDYHWSSDVTIYYKSETRSKSTFSLQVRAVERGNQPLNFSFCFRSF